MLIQNIWDINLPNALSLQLEGEGMGCLGCPINWQCFVTLHGTYIPTVAGFKSLKYTTECAELEEILMTCSPELGEAQLQQVQPKAPGKMAVLLPPAGQGRKCLGAGKLRPQGTVALLGVGRAGSPRG